MTFSSMNKKENRAFEVIHIDSVQNSKTLFNFYFN